MKNGRFSEELRTWLKRDGKKTIGSLEEHFGDKSIAVVIKMLMFVPALPIPTGGITHIFELIVMLMSLGMIFGKKRLLITKKIRARNLGAQTQAKAIPFIISKVQWFEKFSRPRLVGVIRSKYTERASGLLFFLFALAAFLAPPFSGLDTFASMGAVILALGIILNDALIYLIGAAVGLAGVAVVVAVGGLTVNLIKHFSK